MATVVGVRFRNMGKLYYFDPGQIEVNAGDGVIVETARGMEYGEVVTGRAQISDESLAAPLKNVIRVTTDEDLKHLKDNREKEKKALKICAEKVAIHKLDMKLVDCEYTFDGSKILFYFTADKRVDFRALVKDLASVFHTRIELRQIGVRDEAQMLGGLGACGRPLCCSTFLGDFQPVSIKMAKEQGLSLNPTKISGVCGRLMCCLKYEEDQYESVHKKMPKIGRDVMTPDGPGTVTAQSVLKETVTVRIPKGDETELKTYPMSDVQSVHPRVQGKKKDEREKTAEQPEASDDVQLMVKELEQEDGLDPETAKEEIDELMGK